MKTTLKATCDAEGNWTYVPMILSRVNNQWVEKTVAGEKVG